MSLTDRPARTVHPLLEALFGTFEATGVSWCLLRGEDELGAPAGDVDLLVSHGDRGTAWAGVAAARFALLRRWGGGSQSFFVAYDQQTDLWLRLHLTTRVAFGRRLYALDSELAPGVLHRRRRRHGIPMPAADDDFWLRLLHCLLDKNGIARKHRGPLARLAVHATSTGEPGRWVSAMCPAGWDADRILAHARDADWSVLEGLGRPLARSWAGSRPVTVAARAVRNAASLYLRKTVEPFTRRGLTVAVLGPDGAGKSSLTRAVATASYLPIRVVYLGLYPQGRGRRLAWLPGGGTAVALGRLWRSWLVIRYHQARRRLVLCDRHPYDGLVAGTGGRRARARRRLLSRALPAPDLVVVLDAPGAVLFERAGEHTPELLEEQRRGYRRLAARLPQAEMVDATHDVDWVRRQVTALIWEHYRARHAAA